MDREVDNNGESFFIAGSPRSGTTLLQQLLATHSRIVGVNETEILKKINPGKFDLNGDVKLIAKTDEEEQLVKEYFNSSNFKNLSRVEKSPYLFLHHYCEAHRKHFKKQAYVEKSPIHSLFINEILDNIRGSKIIVILRDPKSIISSRINAKRISRGKRFKLPRSIQLLLNLSELGFIYTIFAKIYDKRDDLRERIMYIKYEDLILEKEKVLMEIWKFLKLPSENVHLNIKPLDIRLEYWGEIGSVNSSYNRKYNNKIIKNSLNKWKNNLYDKEINYINSFFKYLNLRLINLNYGPFTSDHKHDIKSIFTKWFMNIDFRLFQWKNIKFEKLRKGL